MYDNPKEETRASQLNIKSIVRKSYSHMVIHLITDKIDVRKTHRQLDEDWVIEKWIDQYWKFMFMRDTIRGRIAGI